MISNKNRPKVSVCVVTYNQEKYIRQCIQSVIDQKTDFDFNIIIGEDCSTDGTRSILQELKNKYPSIIKLVLHERNVGICDNFRIVHFMAEGDYIAHLDGDDFWHQNKLQAQFDFMEGNSDCTAVYTNAFVQSATGEPLGIFSSGVKEVFDLPYLIEDGNFLVSSSIFYKTKFREIAIPSNGEFVDFYIHIQLATCGRLGFIDKNLVTYTYNSPTSIISSNREKVRVVLLNALRSATLSTLNSQIVNKAKLKIIADYILIEILHSNFSNAYRWLSILSDESHSNNISSAIKLTKPLLHQVKKKIKNKFALKINAKSKKHVIFYRK